jgi:hypothetical protein
VEAIKSAILETGGCVPDGGSKGNEAKMNTNDRNTFNRQITYLTNHGEITGKNGFYWTIRNDTNLT